MPGTLTVRPLSAKLTRNTEFFGKMDPYCKVVLGKQKLQSQVCKNGGKHPHWEDTLVLKRQDEQECHIELKERDWLLPDELIGECDVNLMEVERHKRVLKWYPMSFHNKPVGQVLLELEYEPDQSVPSHQHKTTQQQPLAHNQPNEIPMNFVHLQNPSINQGNPGRIESAGNVPMNYVPVANIPENKGKPGGFEQGDNVPMNYVQVGKIPEPKVCGFEQEGNVPMNYVKVSHPQEQGYQPYGLNQNQYNPQNMDKPVQNQYDQQYQNPYPQHANNHVYRNQESAESMWAPQYNGYTDEQQQEKITQKYPLFDSPAYIYPQQNDNYDKKQNYPSYDPLEAIRGPRTK